jgi:hypothetical protein
MMGRNEKRILLALRGVEALHVLDGDRDVFTDRNQMLDTNAEALFGLIQMLNDEAYRHFACLSRPAICICLFE